MTDGSWWSVSYSMAVRIPRALWRRRRLWKISEVVERGGGQLEARTPSRALVARAAVGLVSIDQPTNRRLRLAQ
jgi:hypothetical protein